MATWVYKAGANRVGYADTCTLAQRYNFLCRALYDRPGRSAARVRRVQFGDFILYYFPMGDRRGTVKGIGTFRVVEGERFPGRFVGPVKSSALQEVADTPANAPMLALLRARPNRGRGHAVDPELGVFTGWAIEDLKQAPPDFAPEWLPDPQTTLYLLSPP